MPLKTFSAHTTLLLACLSTFASAPSFAADSPAGHYVLTGMREVGSELMLRPNGQFEYMLAYGAYDEYAKGKWKAKGRQVVLNSEGTHTPPKFTLTKSSHDPEQGITVLVTDKNGKGIAGIDVAINLDGTNGEEGYTQTYGYRLQWDKAAAPKAIGLGIKMYGMEPQWFESFTTTHNSFVFTFEPGDLGKAQFRDMVFEWDGAALTVERDGQKMRYVKQ